MEQKNHLSINESDTKREEKVKRFYRTSVELFARKGYYETTMDEIAQAMGVAKGTIYYNFENKEDLYLSVIQQGVDMLKEQLLQAISDGNSTREKIERIIKCQLDFFEQEHDLVSLFLIELFANDQQRSKRASKMLSDCLQIIRSTIDNGVTDGSLRGLDPETATSSLFGMVAISAMHYIWYKLPIPGEKVGTAVEEIFFRGLATPD